MTTLYWRDHYGRNWPVCECLQKWLPAYEAELLRRGLIIECIDLYQTIGNASASAKTHSTGGCADLKQRTTEQLRVARNMGAAAWKRDADPNDGQPDMSPEHTHLSLKGCPHAHSSAKAQVTSCENGHNGLAGNGPDDGPRDGVKWPLRTWEQGIAWAKEQAVTVYPAQILGKHFQKVTLPVDGPDSGDAADELLPPRLLTYSSQYFRVASDGKTVIMMVPFGGATTEHSDNARCEGRETWTDGRLAKWDGRKGHHGISAVMAVNELPPVKPDVVLEQIHNGDADVATIRAEGVKDSAGKLTKRVKLWGAKGNTSHYAYLGEVLLTQRFTVGLEVAGGRITFVLDGKRHAKTVAATADCFLKLGNYGQFNPETAPGEKRTSRSVVRLFDEPEVWHAA